MRARTVREGSVGLLILVGLGLLGFLIFWIRGLSFGNRSYRFTVLFENTAGMQVGAPVRYRGVPVGSVTAIRPTANRVEAVIQIEEPDLHIPDEVLIEANQSGFLGETSIDITPVDELTETQIATVDPLAQDCNSGIIICSGDRVEGEVGVNFNELTRSTIELADQFTDEELFANIQNLTENSANAAAEVAQLTQEVTTLVRLFQGELEPLSNSAITLAASVSRAADQLGGTAQQTNELLAVNRVALTTTLNNLSATSSRLRNVVDSIAPIAEEGELAQNLQLLSANAAAASGNLREITDELNDPTTVVMLQQTLESARATFQNMQKITADLDDLTGDPELRENIRELINGFSSLVSTTQDLEQQIQIAQSLSFESAVTLPASEEWTSDEVKPVTGTEPTTSSSALATDLNADVNADLDADIDNLDTIMDAIAPTDQAEFTTAPKTTLRPMTITNSIGERVQIAFPIVQPVEDDDGN
jgi:phospholipid/cholesterol/gamma-HCH transport system substrate-binding protein